MVTMIRIPDIARMTHGYEISRVIVRFVMVDVMHFKSAAIFLTSYATSLAAIAISLTNQLFELACKFWAVWQHGYAAVPPRIIRPAVFSRNDRDSRRAVFFTPKGILFTAKVNQLSRCPNVRQPFGTALFNSRSYRFWRSVNATIVPDARFSSLLNCLNRQPFTFVMPRNMRVLLAFPISGVTGLKSSGLATIIVSVLETRRLTLLVKWRDKFTAPTSTWDWWHGGYFGLAGFGNWHVSIIPEGAQ